MQRQGRGAAGFFAIILLWQQLGTKTAKLLVVLIGLVYATQFLLSGLTSQPMPLPPKVPLEKMLPQGAECIPLVAATMRGESYDLGVGADGAITNEWLKTPLGDFNSFQCLPGTRKGVWATLPSDRVRTGDQAFMGRAFQFAQRITAAQVNDATVHTTCEPARGDASKTLFSISLNECVGLQLSAKTLKRPLQRAMKSFLKYEYLNVGGQLLLSLALLLSYLWHWSTMGSGIIRSSLQVSSTDGLNVRISKEEHFGMAVLAAKLVVTALCLWRLSTLTFGLLEPPLDFGCSKESMLLTDSHVIFMCRSLNALWHSCGWFLVYLIACLALDWILSAQKNTSSISCRLLLDRIDTTNVPNADASVRAAWCAQLCHECSGLCHSRAIVVGPPEQAGSDYDDEVDEKIIYDVTPYISSEQTVRQLRIANNANKRFVVLP